MIISHIPNTNLVHTNTFAMYLACIVICIVVCIESVYAHTINQDIQNTNTLHSNTNWYVLNTYLLVLNTCWYVFHIPANWQQYTSQNIRQYKQKQFVTDDITAYIYSIFFKNPQAVSPLAMLNIYL